jgi:hypothetical protein
MPTAGLSLVGFMDEPQAIQHLQTACIPANPSQAALVAEWNAAKTKLGDLIAKAGNPEILDIPAAHAAHMQQVSQTPWITAYLATVPQAEFKLVEIDPLLAYQFAVDTTRSNDHCAHIILQPAEVADILPICLPLTKPSGEYHIQQLGQSVIIKSRSLNLRMLAAGAGANMAGINFDWAVPLVEVVRVNGRCYLFNGFHRTFGIRIAGATHVPCLFRDVADHASAGIRTDGATFDAQLLESNNPPTLAHFTQGRAHSVTLRATTRILHVSWAEYGMYDE